MRVEVAKGVEQKAMRPPPKKDAEVGLCARCHHARVLESQRSHFFLCELSRKDPRFAKYPPLPVRQCAGFQLRNDM